MKLTVLGAASPRFPLLLNTILRRNLPIDELALYDLDVQRLKLFRATILEEVLRHHGRALRLEVYADFQRAVEGADFVFSSIRVGGQEARLKDETVPLELGLLGQETVGGGGFSLALRTIPVAVRQAEQIHAVSPEAWIVNFTNPAGIITQAVKTLSPHDRIVGICDAPEVITRIVCELYRVPFEEVKILYFGLNHLGWVYSIKVRGREILGELIDKNLEAFFQGEPFYAGMREEILKTGLLPNEYFFYYLHPEQVAANQQGSSLRRAAGILRLDGELRKALELRDGRAVSHFNLYMDRRNGSYMTNETGYERPEQHFSLLEQEQDWGYDAVALSVLDSLMGSGSRRTIINVENRSFCSYLEAGDIIETSSVRTGERWEPAGPCPDLPEEYSSLLVSMKDYERTLIRAAGTGDFALAVEALKKNPIIPSDRAEALARAVRKAQGHFMEYLR